MTYRGTVRNGTVILENGASLPDGTLVRVEPMEVREEPGSGRELSPLFRVAERAKSTGIADLGINHDHYLYGHPKVTDG